MEKKSYKQSLYSLKELLRAKNAVKFSPLHSITVLADTIRFGRKYKSVLQVNVGESAPKFELPNAMHQTISLDNVLKEKKAVIIFYRGGWCPFCNLQLRVYQNHLEDFEKAGATLIAISPQIPDQSLSQKEKQELKFEVLSDIGNMVAKKYTTVLNYSDKSNKALKGIGVNLDEYYEEGITEVPIPSVFAIDQKGKIIFAASEGGDYKKRVEPTDILAALNSKS